MEKASPISTARAVRSLREAHDTLSRDGFLNALSTDEHRLYLYSLLPSYHGPNWASHTLETLCSANVVALYGWECLEPNVIGCGECGARLAFVTPSHASRREMQDLRRNFVASLQITHHVACVWRAHRVDPGPIFCPSAHTAVAQYHRRVNTWNGFNCPPLAPHAVPEKEGAPDGIERNVHVLAVMGWERAVPATNTEPTLHCRLCARHVWIDEGTPFDVVKQHRHFCPVLHSRSDMLHLCRSLPPSSNVEVEFKNEGDKMWQWLSMLVNGHSDVPLDPQAAALIQAKNLLQRRSSLE